MFGHEIKRDLDEKYNMLRTIPIPSDDDKLEINVLKRMIEVLDNSQFFYQDKKTSIELNQSFVDKKEAMFDHTKYNLRLPYPNCCFLYESYLSSCGIYKEDKFALICEEGENKKWIRVYLLISDTREFFPYPVFFDISLSGKWNDVIKNSESFSEKYKKRLSLIDDTICPYSYMKDFHENVYNTNKEAFHKIFDLYLSGLSVSLTLLSCKNIVQIHKKPSKFQNSIHKINKRYPLVEYKLLMVEKPININKNNKKNNPQKTTRAHIRAGHFKTYKLNEDGTGLLFGKYEGTWWWQPHMSGYVENGVIVKEYLLKSKKEK